MLAEHSAAKQCGKCSTVERKHAAATWWAVTLAAAAAEVPVVATAMAASAAALTAVAAERDAVYAAEVTAVQRMPGCHKCGTEFFTAGAQPNRHQPCNES